MAIDRAYKIVERKKENIEGIGQLLMRRVTIELQPQKSSPNNKEPGRLTTTTIERERKSPYTVLPKYDEDDEEVKRA